MEKINNFLNLYKLPIFLSTLGLVLIIGGLFVSGLSEKPKSNFPKKSIIEKPTNKYIKLDMSGAVVNPGVYEVLEGSRIEDAIKVAGGFEENANKDYISKTLNLSQKVNDGTKIYIPFEGENFQPSQVAGVGISAKVNINTGSLGELEKLPGIGPVTAEKIISGRPYSSIEDLLIKKAVSKSVYERIKDLISL